MRTEPIVLCCLLFGACEVGKSSMSLVVVDDDVSLVADGVSMRGIRVCNTSPEPAEKVSVDLTATTGAWQGAAATSPTKVTVALTDDQTCATEMWRPPTAVSVVRFDAVVDEEVQVRLDQQLVKANITDIELRVQPPVLMGAEASQLKVSVRATTASQGQPSDGATVFVTVADSVPTAGAVLGDTRFVFGETTSIDLFAAKGVTAVKLEASYEDEDGTATSCTVVTALGGDGGALKCPIGVQTEVPRKVPASASNESTHFSGLDHHEDPKTHTVGDKLSMPRVPPRAGG